MSGDPVAWNRAVQAAASVMLYPPTWTDAKKEATDVLHALLPVLADKLAHQSHVERDWGKPRDYYLGLADAAEILRGLSRCASLDAEDAATG